MFGKEGKWKNNKLEVIFINLSNLKMAYISYDKSWHSEMYNNVSTKDRVQDRNLNQLKLKVNDTYKKYEKITTNF